MFAIKSPSNYNEMLAKLNKSTFFTTLFFMVAMRIFDYVPLVLVPNKYDQIQDSHIFLMFHTNKYRTAISF